MLFSVFYLKSTFCACRVRPSLAVGDLGDGVICVAQLFTCWRSFMDFMIWPSQIMNSMKLVIPLYFISCKINQFPGISMKCILPNLTRAVNRLLTSFMWFMTRTRLGLWYWAARGHMLNDLGEQWSGRSQRVTSLSHLWRHAQSATRTAKFSKAIAITTMRTLIQQRDHEFSNANTNSTTRTFF